MTIKVTPLWTDRADQNAVAKDAVEFEGFLGWMEQLGYARCLLHYTDGSVLIRKMSREEWQSFLDSENDE